MRWRGWSGCRKAFCVEVDVILVEGGIDGFKGIARRSLMVWFWMLVLLESICSAIGKRKDL